MDKLQKYLTHSEFIDRDHPAIVAKAAESAAHAAGKTEVAKRCFEFVRDIIQHSLDFQRNPVTCKASDVLLHGTGYCYAKSHLLAALLRANGIPAGLCYQRLTVEAGGPRHSLHGLNAVHLEGHGWYRVDPRGNKPGVEAEFAPPVERLAFPIVGPGEADLPEIWPEPSPVIVRVLRENMTFDQVFRNLPDIDLLNSAVPFPSRRASPIRVKHVESAVAALRHPTYPARSRRGGDASHRRAGAVEAVESHFRARSGRPLAAYPADQIVVGRFGGDAGEEVVARRCGDGAVELHCHGGRAAVARIEESLVSAGCRSRGVARLDADASRRSDRGRRARGVGRGPNRAHRRHPLGPISRRAASCDG